MDNLSEMLNQILSTEEGKAAFEQLSEMMGKENMDFSQMKDMFNQEDENSQSNSAESEDFFNGIDIEMMMKFGQMFSEMNSKDDKNTRLLNALKPHLRSENQEKIDFAIKMMKLISMIPYLEDSGIFKNFFK